MLGLVLFGGFGFEFDHLMVDALRTTDAELNDRRRNGKIWGFDLLDVKVSLSSQPVCARQPTGRADAEESYHDADESNQRELKCAVIAKAVGTALHCFDGSTNVVSRAKARSEPSIPYRAPASFRLAWRRDSKGWSGGEL